MSQRVRDRVSFNQRAGARGGMGVDAGIAVPTVLWLAYFGTAQAAPMPASYPVDVGILAKVLDTNNNVSVAGGKLDFAGMAAVNFTDPAYIGKTSAGAGFARAIGRMLAVDLEVKTSFSRPFVIGLSNNTAPSSSTTMGIYFAASGVVNISTPSGTISLTIGTWTTGLYSFRVVEFSDGFAVFAKGGSWGSTWKLLWIDHTTSSGTLYPAFQGVSQVDYEVERAALVEGNVFPLLASDYALAAFNQTSGFNQSLGSELVVNGVAPILFTGDNPNSYSITEVAPDPEATQRGTGQLHAGAGTGAINLFSSATNFRPIASQAILTANKIYLVRSVISALTSGGGSVGRIDIDNTTNPLWIQATAPGTYSGIGKATTGTLRVNGVTAPIDATMDSLSAMEITVGTPQTMPSADGQIDVFLTAPGTPAFGTQVHMFFRMTVAGQEFNNGWDLNIVKDIAANYTINLDSWTAGVKANRITVSGVTANALKVKFEGDNYQIYRLNSSTWTKIGSTFNNSFNNTALVATLVYDPAWTITRWAGYRYADPNYDAILDQI